MSLESLSPDILYRPCDPAQFSFSTTAEVADIGEIIGQERAVEALHFGVSIRREGYNLFVMGPAGMGKHTAVKRYLEQLATSGPVPTDWVYVNNFKYPDKPRALRLPPGHAQKLHRDMVHLVEDLRHALPIAFESAEYHARIEEIEEAVKSRRETALDELASEAGGHHINLMRTRKGFSFAPTKEDGSVLTPEEYDKLPGQEKERIEEIVAVLQEKLENILLQTPKWQREARDKIKQINRDIALGAAGSLLGELKKRYSDLPDALAYLDAVLEDVINHADDFLSEEATPFVVQPGSEGAPFRRYQVTVMVDHSDTVGSPVIYEDTPTFDRLVGRVEHRSQLGALVTDFTMIKPGALHRANGGYLVLDVNRLLMQPYAWEGLKRALRSCEVVIQSLGQIFSLISTVGLDPEAIPLDVKVVLLGDRLLFYLLLEYEPEFSELFKVAADFEETIDRSPEASQLYAQLIGTLARHEQLLDFDRDAVCRVIEHGGRVAEDSEKLSTHMLGIADLLREADHWARAAARKVVTRDDVQHALNMAERRADRIRNQIHDEIQRGTILIATAGEQVAQVNGLSVIDLRNLRFAQPFRITATARLGEGDVIDIERETELGGAIHSKGVMILSAFLASHYAPNYPLSLSASLVFEQSYGMVEGDSASVGELCALLSALAGVPIRQSLAVTGSVNQLGRVQPIGGVNEKIEGFFDVCRARGLSGEQGVVIPAANVKHLMLREDVVRSVRAGQFHIYAVESVHEALELLTGQPAGERDAEGNFPDDSVNGKVEARLVDLALLRHEFSKQGDPASDEASIKPAP